MEAPTDFFKESFSAEERVMGSESMEETGESKWRDCRSMSPSMKSLGPKSLARQ